MPGIQINNDINLFNSTLDFDNYEQLSNLEDVESVFRI